MKWRFLIVLSIVACSASEAERAQQQAERHRVRQALMGSDVVQATRNPGSPERLVYDSPTKLARDSIGGASSR